MRAKSLLKKRGLERDPCVMMALLWGCCQGPSSIQAGLKDLQPAPIVPGLGCAHLVWDCWQPPFSVDWGFAVPVPLFHNMRSCRAGLHGALSETEPSSLERAAWWAQGCEQYFSSL